MIDIKILRENPAKIKEQIAKKGANPELVDKILEADSKRCESLAELEDAQSQLNKFSKEIIKASSRILVARLFVFSTKHFCNN